MTSTDAHPLSLCHGRCGQGCPAGPLLLEPIGLDLEEFLGHFLYASTMSPARSITPSA